MKTKRLAGVLAAIALTAAAPMIAAPPAQAEVWHWTTVKPVSNRPILTYSSVGDCLADNWQQSPYRSAYTWRCNAPVWNGRVYFEIWTNY